MLHRVVPSIEHGPALAGVEPATVIDVGANKGQFATFAAARWPRAHIISFEPLEEPAAIFRRVLGDRATLFSCALGEEAATLEMHIASREDSSSLLPLGDLQKRVFSMDQVATRQVPIRRLDEALGDVRMAAPALLKIDVQGYEYQVLRGIGALRDIIEWIYVEVSFAELYEGQKLYGEIEALACELGFACAGLFNEQFDGGRRIQADALFRKQPV
jgi:FkbM family methyltransferase